MNALLTGGTGFIGRFLASRLLEDRNNVSIVARNPKKIDRSLNENVEILQGDICDLASLEGLYPKLEGKDVIFHAAASLDYFGDRRKLFQANVGGTINLLNVAKRNGMRKFVYISSVEAIGLTETGDIPADETFVCRPVSTYGESKLEAERIVKTFAGENNLRATVLRLSNVYGQGSQAFIAEIANAILKKGVLLKFLPFYRDRYLHPIHVRDAVDGIIAAARKDNTEDTYILAGEEYVTIGKLFGLVAQDLEVEVDLGAGKNLKDALILNLRNRFYKFLQRGDLLSYFTAGEGGRIHRAYSIEKARRNLDYVPKVSLRDGIAETIGWAIAGGLIKSKI